MTIVSIGVCAVVCGWSILLVISDERQRALLQAQLHAQLAAQAQSQTASPKKSEPAKQPEVGKRKN